MPIKQNVLENKENNKHSVIGREKIREDIFIPGISDRDAPSVMTETKMDILNDFIKDIKSSFIDFKFVEVEEDGAISKGEKSILLTPIEFSQGVMIKITDENDSVLSMVNPIEKNTSFLILAKIQNHLGF